MNESESTPGALMAFFARPIVGIVGSIASVVGIVLSIYLYWAGKESPVLTYFVHPAKAAVVRTDQTSRLSVQFDGKTLSGDITAAQIAIWNAGRKPIRATDVLSPLIVRTGNGAKILEARVQKTSRSVVKMDLDQSRLSTGEVEIHWNILEQNDGGVVQIVYSGNDLTVIKAQATVEGQPSIVQLDFEAAPATPREEYLKRQGWRGRIESLTILALAVIMFTTLVVSTRIRRKKGQGWRNADWAFLLQGVVMTAMGIWSLLFKVAPAPPFGF